MKNRTKFCNNLIVTLSCLFSTFFLYAQITYENAFPNITFEYPVEMQSPNDGTNRMFVVEQEGIIKVFPINENVSAGSVNTFLDIESIVQGSNGQELGLLGLAFHPNYSSNGYFYVYYTTESPVSGISTRMVLSRFKVSSGNQNSSDAGSELILFQFDKNQNNSNHNGGKIAFGPDGYLYISFGDGGGANDPQGNGQNINTVFGSICRIDVDLDGSNPVETNSILPNGNYEIPSDNPFVGVAGLDEIFAYGIRNTWKFSFDNSTGRLWGADVGQGDIEEINLIKNGNNYGWGKFEGSNIINSNITINGEVTYPVFSYNHNQGDVSVTGGYIYKGTEITSNNPTIESKYIYGDFVSGRVWALEYNELNGLTTNTLLFDINGLSIPTFGIDNQGEIYFGSYGRGASIYKLIDGITTPSGETVNGIGDWDNLAEGVPNGVVNAIVSKANGDVFYAGDFSQAGSITANNIALWNEISGWQSFGSGTNGTINALKLDANGNLYAGGSFTQINGISANNIAKWNGSQWSALGSGITGTVATLEVDASNNVYAAGIFETINGSSARNIAVWNGSQWSALTDSNNSISGTNNEIRSLALDNSGILYVGGNFDEAGGVTANRIATWNGTNWGSLGLGTSGFVEAIATTPTDIFVGGNFIDASNNTTVNRVAKWNKTTATWSALGNGVSNKVNALIHDGTFLYAGGSFDVALNSSQNIIVNNFARWSQTTNWEALGSNTNVGVDIKINTLSFAPNSIERIYVGGNFSKAGAINVSNTALWLSDIALGIDDYDSITSVYPNPTDGLLHLSTNTEWILYNYLGKVIIKGQSSFVDLTSFAQGVYYLKTINGAFKVIKQ
tara:strand:+ start:218123 stop:220660 length:2538 start_codon:yes stop_codon:yes gene_type:complete